VNVQETVQLLSERMPEIRQRFGVRELAIFGSVARNEARADSDVDVLVEFAERPTFDNYMGLKLHLEELFAAGVDLAIRSDLRPSLRPRIEQEAVRVP
jgi:uncharacterized protein